LAALLAGILLSLAGAGNAQEFLSLDQTDGHEPIEIRADTLTASEGGALIEAAGDVTIRWRGSQLKAEQVSYAAATGVAEAEGEVELEDEDGNTLRCRRLTMDLDTQTGQVEEGDLWIASEGYRVWGERFRKTGPSSYEIENGGFTTCDGTGPSWRVSADRIQVEIEQYLTGKRAAFWIEGLPVLYTPYVVFPVRQERQSGFLIPRLGYTERDGMFWATRYYWALADNADLTAELQYRSRRGWTEGLEFRYVLSENHEGSAEVTYLRDRKDESQRYTVKAEHQSRFAEGSRVRLHADYVGDSNYFEDLGDTLDERGVELLESYLLGTKPMQQGTLFGLFDYFQSLSGGQDTTIQTLPSVGLLGAETPLVGRLLWDPTTTLTEFWRRKDTKGQRLEMIPGLTLDAGFRFLGASARAGYRQNLYRVEGDTVSRGAAVAEATVETVLFRGYGDLVHTVEQKVQFSWEEAGRGGDPPRFDDGDDFDQTVQLDFLLESRLLRRDDFTTVAGLDLEAVRFLDEEDWSPVRGEVFWKPTPLIELRAEGLYDWSLEDPWLRWSARADGRDRRGDRVFARYHYLKQNAGYFDGGGELVVTRNLSLQYRQRYSKRDSRTLEEGYGVHVSHQCWELLFTFSRNLRDEDEEDEYDRRFYLSLNLKGLGTIGSLKGILP
jgi:LPS-assembly protein